MGIQGWALAIAAVGGAVAEDRATSAQIDAQKKEARAQRRTAEIENARQARRAVAARRIQQAALEQAGATEGLRSSSGIQGAVGSLGTQTAANIGAANTRLAGQVAQNRAAIRGAEKSAKFRSIASGFDAIGSVAGAGGFNFGNDPSSSSSLAKPVPKNNPTVRVG